MHKIQWSISVVISVTALLILKLDCGCSALALGDHSKSSRAVDFVD